MSDPVWEYMTGQRRPGMTPCSPSSPAAARRRWPLPHERDVRYGAHERCRFDFFPAGPGAPVVAFFHAGYWQSRDKDDFLFLAEPFVRAGIAWAAVNYPLCPDVSFDALMDAATGRPAGHPRQGWRPGGGGRALRGRPHRRGAGPGRPGGRRGGVERGVRPGAAAATRR